MLSPLKSYILHFNTYGVFLKTFKIKINLIFVFTLLCGALRGFIKAFASSLILLTYHKEVWKEKFVYFFF